VVLIPKYKSSSSFKKHSHFKKLKSTKNTYSNKSDGVKTDIQDNHNRDFVYHATGIRELKSILESKKLIPKKNKKYVSFSLFRESDIDQFGDVEIVINYDLLWSQMKRNNKKIKEIDYYDIANDDEDESIIHHITGFEGEEDYYAQGEDENMGMDWDVYVETFEDENEVITEKVDIKQGLIVQVILPKMGTNVIPEVKTIYEKVIGYLNEYNIKWSYREE
jgi:hypothetical protein